MLRFTRPNDSSGHSFLQRASARSARATASALVVGGLLWPSQARAQLGGDGEPIEGSNYSVDAGQGPIQGSTRAVGLAGAYVAIADGADGVAWNPASVAVRLPHSRHLWDYDQSIDVAFGGWLPNTDFLNRKQSGGNDVQQQSLLFGAIAGNLYYRMFGVGLAAEARRQALRRESASPGLAPTSLSANYGVLHASLAYGFARGQLVVGAGPRVTGFSLNSSGSSSDWLSVAGVGGQAGIVVKPHEHAWRVGLTAKSAVTPKSTGGGQVEIDGGALWRPESVTLPWEVSAGFAYQFGPRPLNPPFSSVETQSRRLLERLRRNVENERRALAEARAEQERAPTLRRAKRIAALQAQLTSHQTLAEQAERRAASLLLRRYRERPRRYLLVSSELAVIGGTNDSVNLGSAVAGVVQRSRESPALSPRLGLEAEVIENWLKLRAGSYLEPSRSLASSARVHGTFGFDTKLFHWDVFGALDEFDGWTLSVAADAARSYLNTSISLGFWH